MNINLIQILAAILLIALVSLLVFTRRNHAQRVEVHRSRAKGFRRTWRKIYLLPIGIAKIRTFFTGQHYRDLEPRYVGAGVQFANIGEGTYEHGIKSYIPDAATTSRYLLYKRGTDADHCAICGAGDDPLGPSDDQADAGVAIGIKLLGAVKGTVRVVTDGTVNDGDYVKCGATGKVTTALTTNLTFGRAVIPTDCSKADGDTITIIPALPAKYVF
jgi:hypothetical protein